MAVSLVTQTPKQLYGLSTDVKPTAGIPVGSTFTVLDTDTVYMADGSGNWYPGNSGSGGGYSTTTTEYQATATVAGAYNSGDLIDKFDTFTNAEPPVYEGTVWRNVTQETTLASAPSAGNLSPMGGTSAVVVSNFPTTQPVSVSDGADVALGAKSDTQATDFTSAWSVVALLKFMGAKIAGILTVTTGRDTAIGNKTIVATAGTPISLGSQACGDGIIVIANPANTGNIYVFPVAGAKANVIPLAPGDSNFWSVANINELYVDADTSGNSIYWQGAV